MDYFFLLVYYKDISQLKQEEIKMLRTTYENNKKELDMIRYGTLEGNEKDIKNAGIEELENTINNYIKRIKNLEHKKNEMKLRKENLDKSANQEFLYLDDQINRCKTYIMNLKKQLYGYNSEYIRKRVIEEELIVVMSYQRKNKVDREIEEMQLLTKPFIVSKKKANLEKLKEIKEKILLFKTNIKSKFGEKVLTKKLKKI